MERKMECWNNIINTSMIGTDKKNIAAADLPADLSEMAGIIMENAITDKEEKFLQIASLAFNYRQCGVMPVNKPQVTLVKATEEEKEYCNSDALQVLKDIISEESVPLLKFWLQHCNANDKIVPPELIATLLATGIQEKKLQTLIAACCGKRGEWLSRFNEAWNFSANQTTEEFWQTGTPEQRKNIFKEIRKEDPAKAREWLQQVWPQEDAATKLSFLEIFADNIGADDIPFLETLAAEKSKKVKEEALDLLKQIPASAIVLQYQQVLQEAVIIKKEKALLGLTSKMVLQFHLPASIDAAVFKTGIEKLSSNKDLTDDEFIISQLIASVPPAFWETHLQLKPADTIHFFQKDVVGKKMLPAFVIAIKKFNNREWAFAMMQYSETFYIDIIPMLPLQQQDVYSIKFFADFPENIIQYAIQRDQEWDIELSQLIFRHTAKNLYHYPRSFYNQHIHLIPGKIALSLEKFTPPEEYMRTQWSNTSDYILKLLSLKARTNQSFN